MRAVELARLLVLGQSPAPVFDSMRLARVVLAIGLGPLRVAGAIATAHPGHPIGIDADRAHCLVCGEDVWRAKL